MTTFNIATKSCSVCGATSEQHELTSSSAFGWSDLDLRPPEPERSSLFLWVQQCPACGYCAADIEHGDEGLRWIIDSDEYRTQLGDTSSPALANTFLCQAILLEETGNEQAAAWSAINAAWACDDEGATEAAVRARLRAVELFRLELAEGGEFGESDELGDIFASEHALLAELLRRAGRFDEAIEECREGQGTFQDERWRRFLELERSLAEVGTTVAIPTGRLIDRSTYSPPSPRRLSPACSFDGAKRRDCAHGLPATAAMTPNCVVVQHVTPTRRSRDDAMSAEQTGVSSIGLGR